MNAKDKTEDILKSIHVLFSKAEPIEGSKKKVIVDRDRMMQLLKDLNDCMYAMMDEYEITTRSKEKAFRDVRKQSDEIIFDARKNAEDIYAASIMFTDRALDEVRDIIEKTQNDLNDAQKELNKKVEKRKQMLKDNQLDLKNKLSSLIDTQKYLMLIENENIRLRHEAEKMAEEESLKEETTKKATPEIHINEEYFKAAGLLEDSAEEEELPQIDTSLDDEYFEWKETKDEPGEEEEKKLGFFSLRRKQ